MTKFTIYTENKNRQDIEGLLGTEFPSFNVSEIVGFWKGSKENALRIELIEEDAQDAKLVRLCEKIKILNEQEGVLLIREPVLSILV